MVTRSSADLEREAAGLREVLVRKRGQDIVPQDLIDTLVDRATEVEAQCLLMEPRE